MDKTMTMRKSADGSQFWYRDGELHREDGPAVVRADGSQVWYRYGKLHREDGPASVWADGTQRWYRDGTPHREGGPAAVRADGTQVWYRNGKLHREDGPAAVRADGSQVWYRDGQDFRTMCEHATAVELACSDAYTLYRCHDEAGAVWYVAGCRRFTLDEAVAHWCTEERTRPSFADAMHAEMAT